MRTSPLACSVYFFGPVPKLLPAPAKPYTKKQTFSVTKGCFFTVLLSWSGLILSARSKVGEGGALWHATKFPVSCRISSCLFAKNTSAWPTQWLCASCAIPATPRRSPAMPSAGPHSSPKVRQQSRQHQKLCGGHRPQPRPEPAGDPTVARDPGGRPRRHLPARLDLLTGGPRAAQRRDQSTASTGKTAVYHALFVRPFHPRDGPLFRYQSKRRHHPSISVARQAKTAAAGVRRRRAVNGRRTV